ncbi:MAG: hypothetical protein CR217_11490 [Beijerinckiaceae bacterium]|nr:MAG: hypothetical protein CR217_11490 [Beijerinckiaceae bacterium]
MKKILAIALMLAASPAMATCVVSDPNPPLNVRATPNGALEPFKLPNGSQIEIIDTKLSHGRIWIYVADASPLGWVLKNLVHCDDHREW